MQIQAGGRFTAANMPLVDLIGMAYGMPAAFARARIVKGPTWIATDQFDIAARAHGNLSADAFSHQLPAMLRALLESRFALQAHTEPRQQLAYGLFITRPDGALGPHLHRAQPVDCADRTSERTPAPSSTVERLPCGLRHKFGNLSGRSTTLSQLADSLAVWVGHAVVDHTGLAGVYDFDLSWTPAEMPAHAQPSIDPNGPPLYFAIQEQLGLTLVPRNEQMDMVVVDHIEHPTED